MEQKKSNKKLVIILIILAIIISIAPLFALKGAEFGGSDDAGSEMVSEIQGKEYKPWFEPVMEQYLGGELPGEIESLLFCVQTGIGVGILFYFIGKFTERKKWMDLTAEEREKAVKEIEVEGGDPEPDYKDGK